MRLRGDVKAVEEPTIENPGENTYLTRVRKLPAVQLLAIPPFRALLAGNLTNAMGVELRVMAQSWLILELGASQFWVGAAMGLRVVPAIALGLFAGVMVDRLGGRMVLMWERFFLLLLAVVTAVVVVTGVVTLWQIVVLSIVSSAALALGMPATQTMVLSLVPRNSLQAGNSVNALTFSMARAVGPLTGGVLIAGFGLGSPFLALIGLYMLAVLFTFKLPAHAPSTEPRSSAMRELIDGLKYIRSDHVVSRVMLLAFSVIFSAAFVPIIPVYARDRFDVGETGFGVMLAAWAVGQATTALWIASKKDWERKVPAILIATAMFTVAIITFALSTNFLLTLLALGVVGAAIPVWTSATITLLQTQADRKMIGRVMSVYSLSLQMMMFGWFLGAWIGEIIGNAQMMIGGTIIYVVLHLTLIFTSPQLRRL